MSSRYGPLEIHCDAPPYPVARACQSLGFQAPLDVRWLRLSHFLQGSGEPAASSGIQFWKLSFGPSQPKGKACTCGQPLPGLEKYTFTFRSERQADYLLGQCRHCRTIFWEEV